VPKFSPKSDSELNAEKLLPAGEYDFEVTKAINKTFRSGSVGIALTVMVYAPDGTRRLVSDNLVFSDATIFKLSQFSKCVGLYEKYQQGEIDAADCEGKAGRCKLDIEPEGEFPAKNRIKSYVVPKAKREAQNADSIAKQQDDPDWDVPF
jgi:hypothetical protein